MFQKVSWAGFVLMVLTAFYNLLNAQTNTEQGPRLVVGVVVDQMRQEYLWRFYDKYAEGGFKRLMHQGFVVQNGHYNYIPTYTGPGHASVYTGTTPATHGIIANDWYSRELGRTVYCAEDTSVQAVGGSADAGQISPRNMLTTTITDQLKIATQGQGKVIGVSIKDRGSALPAGHMADAAYWYDGSTGEFMSSTFYMETLPAWVQEFNRQKLPDQYLNQTWNTLLPIKTYTESGPDANAYENIPKGKTSAVFPYDLKKLRKSNGNLSLLSSTPFGNTIVVDFAKAALQAEQLGKDSITDFLAVSFSSTDYIGHAYGPDSKELEDTYIRLDRDLSDFFQYLDEQVGAGNYLLFLTADHAVVDVPQQLVDKQLPGGYLQVSDIAEQIGQQLQQAFGNEDWISYAGGEIYLNRELIEEKQQDLEAMQRFIARRFLDYEGIQETFAAEDMQRQEYTRGQRMLLQRGYHFKRSGDVLYTTESGFLSSSRQQGTSHGTGYTYDTHVPIVFYGWNIQAGETVAYHGITEIAPTLSMLLKITLPSGSDGSLITEIFR